MGSEVIVLVVILILPCIAYFVRRKSMPGERMADFVGGIVALTCCVALVDMAGGSIGTFLVVLGIVLALFTLLHAVVTK
jgi:hypothetical protein